MTRDEDLAKLAARLTDQLGDDIVVSYRAHNPITPPRPGVAVLACGCGRVLDSAEMCRLEHARQDGAAVLVERIVCAVCANPNLGRWPA